jgi:hypothetical protein
MKGSIKEIFPDSIGERSESMITELLKRKVTSAARLAVELLHAMEERFGSEAREVAMEMARNRVFPSRSETGDPAKDLRDFCLDMERKCVGSHRWERTIDEPERIAYRFTGCLWAEVFRELGEPDLGYYYCAGDEPALKAYNPALGFKRTKVLMKGDDHCDHEFYIEGS